MTIEFIHYRKIVKLCFLSVRVNIRKGKHVTYVRSVIDSPVWIARPWQILVIKIVVCRSSRRKSAAVGESIFRSRISASNWTLSVLVTPAIERRVRVAMRIVVDQRRPSIVIQGSRDLVRRSSIVIQGSRDLVRRSSIEIQRSRNFLRRPSIVIQRSRHFVEGANSIRNVRPGKKFARDEFYWESLNFRRDISSLHLFVNWNLSVTK